MSTPAPTVGGPGITTLSFHGPQLHVSVPHLTVPSADVPATHVPGADAPSVEVHFAGSDVPSVETADCAPSTDSHLAVTADLVATNLVSSLLGAPGTEDGGCGDQSSYPADATATIAAHADVPAETGLALHLDVGGDTLQDVPGADVHVAAGTDTSHC